VQGNKRLRLLKHAVTNRFHFTLRCTAMGLKNSTAAVCCWKTIKKAELVLSLTSAATHARLGTEGALLRQDRRA